ncbi:diacylglycerol lipase-beta-like isoform X2 [Gigantopelta aegis]|uniref:diacylglycerol lipase-beta-like isoform X2 n=1 Tax=Gigantopelta aegis TaxID=1735272 RepID=UPI001B88D612|nr:diacylglycerol lipase-beta-like isoform X2 [Gigantopelta aegis]
MPGLFAFNRKWSIGSDDLVFPILVEICIRIAWMIAIAVVFHIHQDAFTCEDGNLLRTYYIGVLTILSITLVVSALIMYTSMQGTITKPLPRRRIPLLLYIKTAVIMPDLAWMAMGTFWAFGKSYGCDYYVVLTVKGAVICAWVATVVTIIGILIILDPLGKTKHEHRRERYMTSGIGESLEASQTTMAAKIWERRCRLLCCCVACNKNNQNAFTDISRLVAEFFKDVDLVPTDIAAGLLLVLRQQRLVKESLGAVIVDVTSSERAESQRADGQSQPMRNGMIGFTRPELWMNIKLMSYYMKFALASYGWPFYIYSNMMTGICKVATRCRCCACVRAPTSSHCDNVCECHTAAVRRITGLQQQDLVYVCFHNKCKEIPFFVAIDRRYNSVVIAIRGTLSLEDALTDLSAESVSVDIAGVPDAYAHAGMMDCARYIKSQLDNLDLLGKAFGSLQEGSRLVITGHSLGAGTAALLAVLLKPVCPNLICFAYSPPGGLMSPSLSHHVQSYVCSVVVGKDLVPRLGMPTMHDLKLKILRAIHDCQLPKYRILAQGCIHIICSCLSSQQDDDSDQQRRRPLLESSESNYMTTRSDETQDVLRDAIASEENEEREWPAMLAPGQVLHIVEVSEDQVCCGQPSYSAMWVKSEDFSEIIISPRMLWDHFPDVVMKALEQLEDRNYVPRATQVSGPSALA